MKKLALALMAISFISLADPAADNKEILDLKALVQKQDQYNQLVTKQRDEAYKELEKDGGKGLPFYFWVVLGAAGAFGVHYMIHK